MKYFAYGSNMDLNRIFARIHRHPDYSVGHIQGYNITFNKQAQSKPNVGYANIIPFVGEFVWGLVYELTETELSVIDRHEGVRGNHYYRHFIDVHITDRIERSVTYIAHQDKVRDNLLPERKYLDHLLAAKDLLPPEYVSALQRQPTFD